jgi:hypothetical protein
MLRQYPPAPSCSLRGAPPVETSLRTNMPTNPVRETPRAELLRSVACCIRAIVCRLLNTGSATCTCGIPTATRTKLWRYKLKKLALLGISMSHPFASNSPTIPESANPTRSQPDPARRSNQTGDIFMSPCFRSITEHPDAMMRQKHPSDGVVSDIVAAALLVLYVAKSEVDSWLRYAGFFRHFVLKSFCLRPAPTNRLPCGKGCE